MPTWMVRCLQGLLIGGGLSGCSAPEFLADDYLYLGDLYDVTIRRDVRGVPHVLGNTNEDAAFGLGYSQAEDNWQLIEESMPVYRGNNALYQGQDGAATDFLVRWLGLWETLEENYRWDLSPEARSFVEAYADGLNFYAATHPNEVDASVLPISGQDVVAGFMVRHLLFYGFEKAVGELLEEERQRPVSEILRPIKVQDLQIPEQEDGLSPPALLNTPPPEIMMRGVPIGSNAFAVAPSKSADGATRLAINSHQPTTGPVAWYEAHLKSAQGLNVMGGLFPGSPVIHVGFTQNLAWAATVNNPDLVDVYVLEINPDNPNQYRLDGQWRDLEVRDIEIKLRLWGFFPWTVTREGLRSAHGPVLRTDHGTYAVRYAGMDELRQVEQWYRMNQAKDFLDWKEAMRMRSFASFNFVYADKVGNIMFVHNSLTPKRDPRYDWQQYLPGDDSALIWKEYLGFSQLPQVINPRSGYVLSANQTPFNVSGPEDNPKIDAFKPGHGFQMDMTNRAQRGLELFLAYGPTISADEFSAIKHDKYYSANTHYVAYIGQVTLQAFTDPLLQQASEILAGWDLGTDVANTGAALGTCFLRKAVKADGERQRQPPAQQAQDSTDPTATDLASGAQLRQSTEDLAAMLSQCAESLQRAVGRLDPAWGDINRHVRGDLNLPIAGGPDILRAVYGSGLDDDGFLTNVAGDGLYYLVSWDADGELSVQGVHQYGSATLDAQSPHYADQAEDFVNEVLHAPLFDELSLQNNLLRAYRPGQEP
jgi:acyl-homoserine-lactone acylase